MTSTIPPLLFQAGKSIAEVSFPAYSRKRGGTCDFMTKDCAKYCILQTNQLEKDAFAFFEDNPVPVIVRNLIEQMLALEATTLGWWIGSGDCPERLTNKFIDIIYQLSKSDIPQNGFTRNEKFWSSVNEFSNVRIALTVERQAVQEFLSEMPTPTSYYGYLISEPDYERNIVLIYKLGVDEKAKPVHFSTVACGGGWVTYKHSKQAPPNVFIEDCSMCLKEGVGCYDLVPQLKKEPVHGYRS